MSVDTNIILNIGLVSIGLFLVLGSIDGIYFHLIKYKLHLHSESRLEHIVHTTRGITLGLITYLIMSHSLHSNPEFTTALYLAAGLIVCDLALEVVDIYIEKKSRQNLGGVSSHEMVIHVFASSFRMVAIVLLMLVAYSRGFSPPLVLTGSLIAAASVLLSILSISPLFSAKDRIPNR